MMTCEKGNKIGVLHWPSSRQEPRILVGLGCCQIVLKVKGYNCLSFLLLLFHSVMAYLSKLPSFMVTGLM